MSAWITDRLPTREDGDYEGLVWWQRTCGTIVRINYSLICSGEPWQPITYPEPYVKPKVWTLDVRNCEYNVCKNGVHVWTFFPRHWTASGVYTENHIQAMTDALNRLEEGV